MNKRKVYVETNMAVDDINTHLNRYFRSMAQKVERVSKWQDADFILVDIDHPIPDLDNNLRYCYTFKTRCKPVVLITTGENGEAGRTKKAALKNDINFPVCVGNDQVSEILDWFHVIFPPPQMEVIDRTTNAMIVGVLREGAVKL